MCERVGDGVRAWGGCVCVWGCVWVCGVCV